VTGGAGGIGTAIVRRLAEAGRTVVCADLPDAIEGARFDGDVHLEPVDVTSTESIEAMVAAAAARGPLTALVNCAGVLRSTPADSTSDADIDLTTAVNLSGAIRVTHAAVPHLVEGSAIVNVSSISAASGGVAGVSVYAATKAGLEGFTRASACELARRGIRVNAVAPGLVRAPMAAGIRSQGDEPLAKRVPLHRLAEPEEIAEPVEFLLSSRASYVTGAVLVVDGGLLAK
jgi:3-oxoacyl-[acyl-carrier protein] reductase